MANEYSVNQSDLVSVANAIRTKGGTSEALVFPDGFVSAVQAIQAGGGGGGDIAPFSSVVCGTFTLSLTKNLTIDGVSNCKIFAMRCVENKYYSENTDHIISAVLVNTEASSSSVGAVKGVSAYFGTKFVNVSSAGMCPTISGDTLTFDYYLSGTYEYVMVSK